MNKKTSLKKKVFDLLFTLVIASILIYCFFLAGIGQYIDIWSYLCNCIKPLLSERELLGYLACQIFYLIMCYFVYYRKPKTFMIGDYFKAITMVLAIITVGIKIINTIENEVSIILLTISILIYIGLIIAFLIKLSIQIYISNETNQIFYLYEVIQTYKIQSLIVIIIISSQILILIYAFIYFRFNIILPDSTKDIGLIQNGETIVKSFTSIYYFSSVTFFTVGYGDILPYGNKLRLLATSEMITGFVVNLLYVPVIFTFIIDLFNRNAKEKSKHNLVHNSLFLEPLNTTGMIAIPCLSFKDIKDNKHNTFSDINKVELLHLSFVKDMKIQNYFYVDIVDDSLAIFKIYCGDKLLILKQDNLKCEELGMFFWDNSSKKIIFGSVKDGFKKEANGIELPYKWVQAYWNNIHIHVETILPIGKVVYIKRKN